MNQEKISAVELKRAIEAGGTVALIDVRTPAEYETTHIEGAVLMPVDGLDCAAVKTAAGDAALRVLVCQSGMRADKAAGQLAAGGVCGFVILEGGMNAWRKAGGPEVRGKFTLPLERQVFIVAGFMVLLGVVLGWLVHPGCYGLSGFVGAGLMMAGFTGFCPMGRLIARMPWNQRGKDCCSGGSCCGAP